MKRRRNIGLLAVAVVLAVVLAYHYRAGRGPVYQGKSVSYWFNEREWMQGPAMDAFRSLGPAAVPYLVSQLKHEDSALSHLYWDHWRELPVWLRRRLPVPEIPNSRQKHALSMLILIGPPAQAATPELIATYERTYRKRYQVPEAQALDWLAEFTNPSPARISGVAAANSSRPATNKLGVVFTGPSPASADDYFWRSELQALAEIGGENPRIIPILLVALREPNRTFQAAIAGWLREKSSLAAAAKISEPILVAALQDTEPMVRVTAADLLLKLTPDRKDLIPVLAQALEDKNMAVRAAAMASLAKVRMEPTLVPVFCRLLGAPLSYFDQGFQFLRDKYVAALAQLGRESEEAIALERQALTSANPWARAGVAEALGKTGPAAKSAVPELRALLKEPEELQEPRELSIWVRYQTAVALWLIAGEGEAVSPTFTAYYQLAIQSPTKKADLIDFWTSAGVQGLPAVPALVDILQKDASNRLRAKAAKALAEIGPGAVAAVPALEQALQDEFMTVRKEAAAALKKIRGSQEQP